MKVVLPGGSGHVGAALVRFFAGRGDEVVILTRRAGARAADAARRVAWDGRTLGPWVRELEDANVVINLAGRSVDCRYTETNLREMRTSRLESTRAIGHAIAACAKPPRVWLQASTATIYSHRYDAPNDETTGVLGGDTGDRTPHEWLASVYLARDWEKALDETPTPLTRKIALRSALTLTPDRGSIFFVLARLARLGLGGTQGDGRQRVSWIHEHDFTAAIDFLINRDDITGAVNLSAPNPIPNAEFMAALRRAVRAPFGLPLTKGMIEAGAVLLRTEPELILKSRYVVPTRLLEAGLTFRYPSWPDAAAELAGRL